MSGLRTALTLALTLALSHSNAVAQPPSATPKRPAGATGTVIVPDHFLRRWDPVTIFFDRDLGPAGDPAGRRLRAGVRGPVTRLRAALAATVGRRLLVRIWLHGFLLFAGVMITIVAARYALPGHDAALDRLLFRAIGDNNAPLGLLFFFDSLDDDAILQWANFHSADSLSLCIATSAMRFTQTKKKKYSCSSLTRLPHR